MVDVKGYNGTVIKSIPIVKFSSVDCEMAISSLFDTNIRISEYLGLVLLRLGFEVEDSILLANYNKDNNSFDCIVNDRDYYNIIVNNDNNLEIILTRFNIKCCYDCIPSSISEIGNIITLSKYSVGYPDGKKYTRCLSVNWAKFVIEMDNYILEFQLEKPRDVMLPLFDEEGKYSKYKLDNEMELFEYFSNLKFPVLIFDIYKELCDRFLSDVSAYPEFSLKISKLDKDNKIKVVDLLVLRDGNFEKAVITNADEYTVYVDSDDNWKIEISSCKVNPVNFIMSSKDGKISCEFNCNDNRMLEDYIRRPFGVDMKIASKEVMMVKKKIKTLFVGNKGSK